MTDDWNDSQQNQKEAACPGEIRLNATGESVFPAGRT